MDFKQVKITEYHVFLPVDDTIVVSNNAILTIGMGRSKVGPTMKLEDMDENNLHRVFMSFKSESENIINVIDFVELNKAEFRYQDDKVEMILGIREEK